MNKTRLKKYAELLAKCGVRVQRGQDVLVYAGLDQPEFVAMVVDALYKEGARSVTVEWDYQPVTKLGYRHMSEKTLGKVEDWQVARLKHRIDTLPAMLYIDSEDPDGLKGVNQMKIAKAMQARAKIIKPLRDQMENKYQWCIAAVPGKAWAKKVFPGERTSVAMEKLWEAILHTARVFDDPIEEWNKHNADLANRCAYLNDLKIKELRYKAPNGTDFKVGMIPEGIFCAGGETTLSGVFFNPNIPSEEVFTSPMKGKADGIVYASMPLSYQSQLIENFWVKFENGKVVDVGAEKNEALLRQMISMDEGAAFLGECALVPYSSPIRESGILFYNTLFDENAACHLALGRGFSNCLEGYETRSEEDAKKLGINDSMIHVDFMIGTKDLSIDAVCEGGKVVPIFRDGNWAF